MSARVRLETHRRRSRAAFQGESEEMVILRDEEVWRFSPKVIRCNTAWSCRPRGYACSE